MQLHDPAKLSEQQKQALLNIFESEGLLVSRIPEKNTRNVFGDIEPGIGIYRKLIALGLAFETEEDPVDIDGTEFHFTPSLYLTWRGQIEARYLKSLPIDPVKVRKDILDEGADTTPEGRCMLDLIDAENAATAEDGLQTPVP